MGNPSGAAALRRAGKGNADSVKAIKAKADTNAATLAPMIEELRVEGAG